MTNQHRATPEQWDLIASEAADCSATHACILELRARVEELWKKMRHRTDTLAAADGDTTSLIIKVTNRIKALEAAHLEQAKSGRFCTDAIVRHLSIEQPAPSPAVDRVRDLQDRIRDGSLTLADALAEIGAPTPAPAPTDSLVERVGRLLANFASEGLPGDDARPTARFAIREVAAWLRSEYPKREGYGTAWANLIEEESNQ
jgi:hypothetical protein